MSDQENSFVLNFGQYKGNSIKNIPGHYIAWVVLHHDDPIIREIAEEEATRRGIDHDLHGIWRRYRRNKADQAASNQSAYASMAYDEARDMGMEAEEAEMHAYGRTLSSLPNYH